MEDCERVRVSCSYDMEDWERVRVSCSYDMEVLGKDWGRNRLA